MRRLYQVFFVAWGALTGALLVLVLLGWNTMTILQDRVRAAQRLEQGTIGYCERVHRVNSLCEQQLNRVLDQLGVYETGYARRNPFPDSRPVPFALGGPAPGENDARGQ